MNRNRAIINFFTPLPSNDIEFSGERKRVRCNELLGSATPTNAEGTRG
jgi:hypothetical protein